MAEYTPEEKTKRRDEVSKWNSKISSAKKWRDQICDKHRWKEMISEYKGQWDLPVDIDILPINLIFAYVKTELPSLYIKDPHIKVNPKNRTSIATAKVLEAVINYIWYYKKLKREIKKCIIDALLIGHSWLKTGYTGTFGTVEDGHGGVVETIESEDFFAYRLPWDCVVFDPDALDPPHDCEWIAHSVWLPVDEIRKNSRYKNTQNIQASFDKKNGSKDDPSDKYAGKACLTEVWNMKDKTVFTVTEGVDDYVEDPKKWPYELRGYPFSFLKFNFSNDEAYGISDVAMFEPQVLELIKVRSAALDHLKRYNRQLQIDPSLGDDEVNKLMQGITGSCIKADTSKPAAIPIAYPALPQDTYAVEERIKEDMINESGQSPAERGATQKTSTRTKAELIFQRQGAENRRSEKIDLVEDFVEDIAANLIGLVKQFATDPYYIRILGIQSPELQAAIQERPSAQGPDAVTSGRGFTFTADDIEGEYDIEVVSGSSTPIDRGELMKTLLELIELAPKAGAIPGGPLMGAVARLIIETIDVPELTLALEQEQQAQKQAQDSQSAQAEEAKQMQIADRGADLQIEATNATTKQHKVQVDFLKTMGALKSEQAATKNEQQRENEKALAEINREVEKLKHQMQMDEVKLQHEVQMKSAKTAAEIELMKKKEAAKPSKESRDAL